MSLEDTFRLIEAKSQPFLTVTAFTHTDDYQKLGLRLRRISKPIRYKQF